MNNFISKKCILSYIRLVIHIKKLCTDDLFFSSDSSEELHAVLLDGVVNKSDDPSSNIDEVEQPEDELYDDDEDCVSNDLFLFFFG